MPTNLTPEQLQQLLQQFQSGNFNLNSQGFAPTGVIHPGEDQAPSQLLGYTGNFSGMTPGSTYDLYGTDGSFSGQRKVENGGSAADLLKTTVKDLGPVAAMVAGGYGLSQILAGLGAGAAGAAGSSGLGMEVDPMMYGGSGAGTWGSAGGAGAAGGFNAAMDSQAANAAIDAAGGNSLSGYAAGVPAAASGASGSSWLSNLLPSGASSYLGPIAGLLGAAAGSQGVKSQQSTTRDIPEWLKPYVNQQLTYAGGLLDHQMSPQYQQAADQIRTQSMGLLQPQQQSSFSRFFPGR